MIYFYTKTWNGRRIVVVRVRDGEFPMPERDKAQINTFIRRHYNEETSFYSSIKWARNQSHDKTKRTFATHPDYDTIIEQIKADINDPDLRSRVVGGRSPPLLDEVSELSADHAHFYITRKAFKYYIRLATVRRGEAGNVYLHRRGVHPKRIRLTITFQ